MLSDVERTSRAGECGARRYMGRQQPPVRGDAQAVAERGQRDCTRVCGKTTQLQLKK